MIEDRQTNTEPSDVALRSITHLQNTHTQTHTHTHKKLHRRKFSMLNDFKKITKTKQNLKTLKYSNSKTASLLTNSRLP